MLQSLPEQYTTVADRGKPLALVVQSRSHDQGTAVCKMAQASARKVLDESGEDGRVHT